ncbi:MAG: oxidoreductase [Kiritimatiellaeota bacterium]|nr:oxidoreductase [Kiritimatiellota bacterium]
MSAKPQVAFYWCASCGGCEEAVVDLAEDILKVVEAVDIVLWPVAMDFKKADIEARPDKSITVAFINGAVRTSEQEEWARLLRRKSQVVVSFGACANMGGIPALANQFRREDLLKYIYEDGPGVDNPAKTRPQASSQDEGRTLSLPELRNVVRSLDQVIDVEFYLPGCPPTPKLIMAAVQALLSGQLPPKGTVLSPDHALCEECARKDSKPVDLALAAFKRPHQIQIDPEKCLLAQGLVCMGPATRAGCEAVCPAGNMPCTGCFGPSSRVKDQGAKFISSVFSNIVPKEAKEIDAVLDGVPDPIGTFYRYGLSKCILRRKLN